jgi:hypothetical protein
MFTLFRFLSQNEEGQDIAEYAVMLAVIHHHRGRYNPSDWLECKQCFLIGSQLGSVI